MVFTLVPAMRNPCTTSGLVARNTTGVSVGTTMHAGTKEYCCASTRTIADPSGCIAVPRFVSMNSPARCKRLASIVSTFDGGCAAQCRLVRVITAKRKATTSATAKVHRRSDRSTLSMPPALAVSANRASRKEDEHVERKPDREQHRNRRSRQRHGAPRPCRSDALQFLLTAYERDVLRQECGRNV